MLFESRASSDILPFSLSNKKRLAIRHMNRLPLPKKISIPSYDIGKYVGQRTFQHHSVCRSALDADKEEEKMALYC